MIRRFSFVFSVAATTILAGCKTSVTSIPLHDARQTGGEPLSVAGIPQGVVYYLPARSLEVSGTYELLSCPNVQPGDLYQLNTALDEIVNEGRSLRQGLLQMEKDKRRDAIDALQTEAKVFVEEVDRFEGRKLAVKVDGIEMTAKTVPDYNVGAFVIDTRELTSIMKSVQEAKIEVKGGLLKSVAYDAKDHAKEGFLGIARAGFKLASLAASSVPPLSAEIASAVESWGKDLSSATEMGADEGALLNMLEELQRSQAYCTEEAVTALQEKDRLAGVVKELKSTAKAAQKAYDDAVSPPDGGTPDNDLIAARKTALEKANKELQEASGNYATHVAAKLKAVFIQNFVPGTNENSFVVAPSLPVLKKWFNPERWVGPEAKLRKALSLLKIDVEVGGAQTNHLVDMKKVTTYKGIYYRTPHPATVSVSKLGDMGDVLTNRSAIYQKTDFAEEVDFHQYGVLAALEIRSGIFQDNRTVVQFTDDGVLSSFEYRERSARLVEGVGTAEGVLKVREDAPVEAAKREKARIDAETEILHSRKAYEDALKALTPAQ